MKKPSLCILTTSYPSFNTLNEGIPRGKFVHDAAKSFVTEGFDVHVITHSEPGEPSVAEIDGVTLHRFHYFIPGQETLTAGAGIPENVRRFKNQIQVPFYFLAMLWSAFRVMRKYQVDIINAHWAFPPGFIGALLSLMTAKPLVITAYGAEVFPLEKGKLTFLLPFIRWAVRSADIVAAISRATALSVEKLTGREGVLTIPDGIDTDYYHPGPKNEALLRRNGLEEKRVIFFTGRTVERKGHRFLLEAMSTVKKKHPNVVLFLGGTGPLSDDLTQLRAKLGLEKEVLLPGSIAESEMVDWMRTADLFVLPSCIDRNGDTEGSATIALEAMACGTVAIISKVGGNDGAIVDGQGAFYCKPADAADLAEKIDQFLSLGENSVADQRQHAIRHVQDNYRWAAIARRYHNAMSELTLIRRYA